MIEEVRRQFREKPGIMKGEEKPDYKSCVAISTTAALHEMLLPGLMAVIVPVVVGIVLGVEALGGLLVRSSCNRSSYGNLHVQRRWSMG